VDEEPETGMAVMAGFELHPAGTEPYTPQMLGDEIIEHMAEVEATFENHDDDWQQYVVFQCSNGAVMVMYTDTMMEEHLKKMLAYEIVPSLIRHHGTRLFAYVMNTWVLQPKDMVDGMYIHDNPKRREMVTIIICSDAKERWDASALIKRHEGKGPTLDEWQIDAGGHVGRGGKFIDPMVEAMELQGQINRAALN
jgi:hypothetical protein